MTQRDQSSLNLKISVSYEYCTVLLSRVMNQKQTAIVLVITATLTKRLLCSPANLNYSVLQLHSWVFQEWKALFHRKFFSSFLLILTQI